MHSRYTKSNHWIRQFDIVSLQIRITFIQEVMRKKHKLNLHIVHKMDTSTLNGQASTRLNFPTLIYLFGRGMPTPITKYTTIVET